MPKNVKSDLKKRKKSLLRIQVLKNEIGTETGRGRAVEKQPNIIPATRAYQIF